MKKSAFCLVAAVLAFGFGARSASADPILFYLVPSGPTTVPTAVPVGTTTYQLWIDPSGVYAPALYGPSCLYPINGGCTGVYGVFDFDILGNGSLTLTAFTPNTSSPAFTSGGLFIPCVGTICAEYPPKGPEEIQVTSTGTDPLDTIGNSTPFEVGSMSIANDGSGAGTITVDNPIFGGTPYYNDANVISGNFPVTGLPQTLAVAAPVPEPSTLLLLAAGLAGLTVVVRARRPRAT
jgi:hypothetical protein